MEDRIHVRVDNRLLHGQVVQFWIGHLEIAHLIVADDEVARTEAMAASTSNSTCKRSNPTRSRNCRIWSAADRGTVT